MSMLANIPRLYFGNRTTFATEGIGALTDAASVIVHEELNGEYNLEMVYPVNGVHFSEIAVRELILAKPNPIDDPYPFRIYSISKPINGKCTIRANGWHYDLSGIPIMPFTSGSVTDCITKLGTNPIISSVFSFATTFAQAGAFELTTPASVYSVMGGREGSVIDVFGGEWKYGYNNDPKSILLYQRRGTDRGVTIVYGKNLTNVTQEENIAGMYTGVLPFWADADGNVQTLPEQIISVPGSFSFTRILPLDLSAEFADTPSEADLRSAANAYISSNDIGVPAVSLDVSFVPLGQTDQYKGQPMLDNVLLGDTVKVRFDKLGVDASARVIATNYDPIRGRYINVRIGSAKANFADTVVNQGHAVEQLKNTVTSPYIAAMNRATDKIVGNLGGYIVMRYNGNGEPYELLVMDTNDINTATKVWRWNQQGLGYSSTGYNGAYGLAITADGEIVADYITAGHLLGDRITIGAISGDTLSNYFRVFLDGNNKACVEIGADSNQIVLRMVNDRIAFYDSQDNLLAYFSDNSFEIVALQSFVLQNLKIALLDNGAYGFMANA